MAERIGELLVRRGLITQEQLAFALERQAQTGGSLGWILASEGFLTRQALYAALAEARGLPMAQDIERLRTHIDIDLLQKISYAEIIEHSYLPFSLTDGVLVVITSAPESPTARADMLQRFGTSEIAEILVTDLDLTAIASRSFRDVLLDEAVMSNFYRNPEQSARQVFTMPQIYGLGAIAFGAIVWTYFDVRSLLLATIAALQFFFLGSIVFKAAVSVAGARNEMVPPASLDEIAALTDEELPIYTVLVPVYREANVVSQVVEGLKKLDYPPHKLDVMLLLEEDDRVTLEAAKAARASANWRFIVVPNRQPRTKPKACNYGLLFARGAYLVIFDAEDVPEPTQLKAALLAFRKATTNYICFQAALNYFNAEENALTRLFTLEYSYWFDYLVPGLDWLGFPIPLGGTSNHFDVARLRKLGGWDPFNTTEDADLGIRASAEKLRVGVIHSTTFEEANADLGNWIRQRSRWIKGYLQTWLVYSRHPIALYRQIGWKSFFAFNLLVGGTPLSLLAALPLWGIFVVWLLTRTHVIEPLFPDVVLYVALSNLLFGNFLGIYLNMIAIYRRRNFALMPYAMLNPIYWLLQSAAAYKAAWQLFTRPFYWEKTVHGISKFTARSRANVITRAPAP